MLWMKPAQGSHYKYQCSRKNSEAGRKNRTGKEDKIAAVKSQNFEALANYRDKEKTCSSFWKMKKKSGKRNWMNHREIVDEEKVAEVVAMMSGVPVQRIAQAEGKRLMGMEKDLRSKVIGQEEAIKRL